MEKKISMEASQVAMMCTDNEQIYQKERAKEDYFQEDNLADKDRPKGTKEPEIPFVATGIYPRDYILDLLKLAKENSAGHIMIKMGRANAPIQIGFLSDDKLNGNELKLTYLWLAPRIDSDEEDTLEGITKQIGIYQAEVKRLVEKQTILLNEKGKDVLQKPL